MRALLVALMVATPALMLPGMAVDSTQITVLVAMIAGFMTFMEYNSTFPSIVDFRNAPPFNRMRFVLLFGTVYVLSVIVKGQTDPTMLSGALTSMATIISNYIDFPFSPVRLFVLMLPENAGPELVRLVRNTAGTAYFLSLLAMGALVILVRVLGWPTRQGAFNVWINLPLFDPTGGGDVLQRLHRDARINIAIGFLLPFLVPAVVSTASELFGPLTFTSPQSLVWMISGWAFLPASMIMRGLAMARVADMIQDKRRRADAQGTLQTI